MKVDKPFDIGHNRTSLFHRLNPDGTTSPVVDELAFPDMKGLVKQIHAKGLRAGWYLNDCLSFCLSLSDECPAEQCIPGDGSRPTIELGRLACTAAAVLTPVFNPPLEQ
jgi:hypothetical protein